MKEFVRTHKRAVLLGLAAMLVAAATIGGTLAWLTSKPSGIVNTFTPGEVTNEVVEDFDTEHKIKSNVRVKNTGSVDAYIRAALVPIWRNKIDDTGAGIEALLSQLDITPALPTGGTAVNKWIFADGYYYYTEKVAAGASTDALIGTAVVNVAHDGKYLELQILAQSIQADGTDAGGISPAELAWEVVEVQNGKLVLKSA